jgi:hypothetical protein
MDQNVLPILAWTLTLIVCGFAVWKGGAPERWSAFLILAGTLLVLRHSLAPPGTEIWHLLVIEGVVAGGFLVLAMIYFSPWLGAMMLFQAIQFGLHASYMLNNKAPDRFHAIVNNLDSLAMLFCLVLATILRMRHKWHPDPPLV